MLIIGIAVIAFIVCDFLACEPWTLTMAIIIIRQVDLIKYSFARVGLGAYSSARRHTEKARGFAFEYMPPPIAARA